LADDSPDLRRWRAGLKEVHESGAMRTLVPAPTVPFPDDAGLMPAPWMWAGGQIWTWKDGAWVDADPQPPLDGTLLAGSECAARGYHGMVGFGDHYVACRICGETDQVPS
jgi:hypothetical protein